MVIVILKKFADDISGRLSLTNHLCIDDIQWKKNCVLSACCLTSIIAAISSHIWYDLGTWT